MAEIVRSLWLPVGRENFFSPMTDPKLLEARAPGSPTVTCRSERYLTNQNYIPHLRESVLRRLVEVMPYSFGYRRRAECVLCDEPDEADRPVSVTFTLALDPPDLLPDGSPRRAALASGQEINDEMAAATITAVQLHVDESGCYTFVATIPDGLLTTEPAERALSRHIVEVFGDGFGVDRLKIDTGRRPNEGMNAVRRYNGLRRVLTKRDAPERYRDEHPESAPLGALSFFQLNIMEESLCNESLLPSVFFEHYDDARRWIRRTKGRVSVITDLNTFLETITIAADARTHEGQTAVVRRFMVISRGSLQWLTRSVDSVRRSLLDQMMAVSHRRARLIQLDLGGIGYERTPELTGEASESQMRGYVVLIATKMPLLQAVSECAQEAVRELARRVGPARMRDADQRSPDELPARVHDLDLLTRNWVGVLDNLRGGVHALADAVQQDWQERLLYEQEQARSEQEAMAEIERSRRGLPDRRRGNELAYNAVMLMLTAFAVLAAVPAVSHGNSGTTPKDVLNSLVPLWPLFAGIAVLLFVPWLWSIVRHRVRRNRPNSEAYGYEFAFRLDETASATAIHRHLRDTRPRKVTLEGFGTAVLRPLGGWRTDKVGKESELIKVHSVIAVRRGAYKHARFETVVEILARKISDTPEYFIRHCRVFGDSPRPIEITKLKPLVEQLVAKVCEPMLKEHTDGIATTGSRDEPDLRSLTDLTRAIYTGIEDQPDEAPATDDDDALAAVQVPGQRQSAENRIPTPPPAASMG
jgi:hypothetical protein